MKVTFLKGVALGSAVSLATLAATAAFAGTGVGSVFNLGQTNRVNARSQLEGSMPSAVLNVTNSDKSGSASGVSIDVPGGNPPLVVNSTTKVKNLNADMVDGQHASDLQGATSKSCPNGTAIASVTQSGEASCNRSVVLPIDVHEPPMSSGAVTYPPTSMGISYTCSDETTDVVVENVGAAPATLSWDLDGTTQATLPSPLLGSNVLLQGDLADFAKSPQVALLAGHLVYFDQTTVATIDLQVIDGGTDGCDFHGTVEVALR